ncbi:hypothetical protein ACFYP4_21980 [Streptomyces sp. NPDC005551]|uniref:hypothetical protein n=1 Tax=unclassified Streptomyces TaxID=2593676 RepID=UPI0033C62D1D
MLRRISLVLVGLAAVGFLAASPAAAHDSDIDGGWVDGSHVRVGDIVVKTFDAGSFHVG